MSCFAELRCWICSLSLLKLYYISQHCNQRFLLRVSKPQRQTTLKRKIASKVAMCSLGFLWIDAIGISSNKVIVFRIVAYHV